MLNDAIKGARHTGQRIAWTRKDKSAVDLTGATVTARIKNVETGTTVNSDGVFVVQSTVTMNEFTWAYGVADVAAVGNYSVQFTATYPDSTKEVSYPHPWEVVDAF